jgi:spermidine synthase
MIVAQNNTENGEVILRQGPAGYEIIVDGQFLMSTSSRESSMALVELGLAQSAPRGRLQLLIGGLGLGFSLATALASAAVTEVTVIELEAQIIEWHRRDLLGGTVRLLDDPRTTILHQDLLKYIDETKNQFDLVALDIDNGPDWLSHEANSQLYGSKYLRRLQEMLKPQGVLTIWSAAASAALKQDLGRIFSDIEEIEIADHNGEGKQISAFVYVCR